VRLRLLSIALAFSSVAPSCGDDGEAPPPPPDSGTPPADSGGACATRPADAPDPRGELSGVLDEGRGRLVFFGGNTAAPEMCIPSTSVVDELWAFELDCGSWKRIEAAPGPEARSRHASALDTTRDRMLVFGGRAPSGAGYTNFADVWALDLATDTWSLVDATGDVPSGRSTATAVYDPMSDRLLVFGGNTATSATFTASGDLYALDLASAMWTRIDATGAPSPRLYHSATIVGREMIVFGGTGSFTGPFLGDAYAFDLDAGTWRGVASSGPESRFGAEIVADQARGAAILFGGHDGTALGNRNDVWSLDVASGTWTMMRPGDDPGSPAIGMCMFPADFTIPEEGALERRYAFVATSDAMRAIYFGGKTDCGNINDVWSFDFMDASWGLLRPPTGGEACNRSGSVSCSSLCI